MKEPEWLVPGYIPKYGITTIAGEGGVGKTSIWCSLVASITSGKQTFLLGNEIPFNNDPENVIVFSAEDSWTYVLRARLEANGADLDRVGFISPEDERFVDLNFDGDLLKGIIEENRPGVIVFDPLQAFVPANLRMGDRNAMRKCFSPLIGYGEQYKLTSIIIAHANKQSGVWGRKRIADSSDIWDASRSVLMTGLTSEKDVRYISQEKSNYGRLSDTVLFSLDECVPTFKCYSDKKDRDFILADARERNIRPVVEDAKDFIIDTLRERGQMEVSELDELAAANSISKNAMRDAKAALKKEGTTKTWSIGYGNNKKFLIILKDAGKTNE
ncbi:AAA family ATPase [Catenibacillus scindens]|uniref:AAA family ATPase n=1 Tax=Catenibacillus scindens TaxID=673271 RepID=UPI003208B838